MMPAPHRRYPQAPHLDQGGQEELAQRGEGVPGVNGDEAGDAHGAGGGVQGVNVPDGNAVLDAAGQHQQPRTQQNDKGESQGDDPPRRQP